MKQRGFTLIELLIALGVMAVFALMAYRGLDSVLRLHDGAKVHEQQAQAIDRVITQLEADVRQASNVTLQASTQEGGVPRLVVVRRMEGGAGGAGSERVSVEWSVSGTRLLRTTTLSTGAQSAELLPSVSDVSWLTFSTAPPNAGVAWRPVQLSEIVSQPTRSIEVLKGLGLRFTVAGKPLEKLFLVGR
jgi:prepilin-type N-terminal cleavage/methylation domain-containing protein